MNTARGDGSFDLLAEDHSSTVSYATKIMGNRMLAHKPTTLIKGFPATPFMYLTFGGDSGREGCRV